MTSTDGSEARETEAGRSFGTTGDGRTCAPIAVTRRLSAGVNKRCFPPALASTVVLVDPASNARTIMPEWSRAEQHVAELPPAVMLAHHAVVQIEAHLNVQFTLIVTNDEVSVNNFADQYRILSVEKFLRSASH